MAIIGIDLGTTNSLVCVWRNQRCEFIPNAFGNYLTPSIVSICEDGNVLIGEAAKERLITHPDTTIAQFKRWMGTDQAVTIYGKTYRGEDLSALIIRKLVEDAKTYLNEDIEEAIISVPAYFNDDQRWATKAAGTLSGIRVDRIINEPSAAALSTHMEQSEDMTFLVVDFGGGTFDLSIVEAYGNIVEIIAISGDNHLGGKDIDECLRDVFLEEQQCSWDNLTAGEQATLLHELERLKKRMSVEDDVHMNIELQGQMYTWYVDQAKLMNICAPVLMRMKQPLQRIFEDAHMNMEAVDDVVLVGGTCHMPVVVDYLSYLLRREIHVHHNPDQTIAYGCGIAAGIKMRKQEVKDYMLSDICPFTLGIEVRGTYEPIMSAIIERNTTLPCSQREFYTYQSESGEVYLNILQGEHRKAKDNVLMKSVMLKLPPAKTQQDLPIAVRFSYDINGILEVEVETAPNQINTHIVIQSKSYRMDEAEVQRRLTELNKLKLPPHEQEKNRQLLAQGERLYYEAVKEQRAHISALLYEFEMALQSYQSQEIHLVYRKVKKEFDQLDEHIQSKRLFN